MTPPTVHSAKPSRLCPRRVYEQLLTSGDLFFAHRCCRRAVSCLKAESRR